MNLQQPLRYTRKTAWATAASLMLVATGCQKDLDYTKPADANTFEGDKSKSFNLLTENEGVLWYWDQPANNVYSNKFNTMMAQFFKDSTANVYYVPARGIIADLTSLVNSGTLSAGNRNVALQLISILQPFSDPVIRQLMADPANADFNDALLFFLPNYPGFNSLQLGGEEKIRFNTNGPVALSLTFHNSVLLGNLKARAAGDFDYRILGQTKDSVALDGYYTDNANKKTILRKAANLTRPDAFVRASQIILTLNPWAGRVNLRVGGTTIPTPPGGFFTGMEFFYTCYDQAFDPALGWGHVRNGILPAATPDVLKTARMVTVKSAVPSTTNVLTAPAGTVLITMSIVEPNGTAKDLEFVKF